MKKKKKNKKEVKERGEAEQECQARGWGGGFEGYKEAVTKKEK